MLNDTSLLVGHRVLFKKQFEIRLRYRGVSGELELKEK